MKITFVLPYAGLAGGIRVLAIYADRLMKRGHEVFVVSTPAEKMRWQSKVKMFLGKEKRERLGSESHFDGLDVPHRVLERYRPVTPSDVPDADVIVATFWNTAEWIEGFPASKGAKFYFVQHDERVMYPKDPAQQRRVEKTRALPMQKITISQWLVDLLKAETREPIELIPNSVEYALFHAPPRFRQSQPTVGMLYCTAGFKGCDVSLRAFETAAKRIPGLRMIAFGAIEPDENMPLPAGTEFIYRPPQNTIKDIYSRCDLWLCGSRREGFHLPPLEAMACRCPVVSTRVGGPMDLIEDGMNGYLVDVEDSQGLADRMERVLSQPAAEWQRMSEAAYATAKRYSWDDATDLFEKALEQAVRREQQAELQYGAIA